MSSTVRARWDRAIWRLGRLARLPGPEVSQRRIARFLRERPGAPDVRAATPDPASVAVVIPCYGHAGHLPAALESLDRQTRPPDEIVLVDDASPDATAAILRGLADRPGPGGSVVTVLTNPRNLGQAASLNRGIDRARSDLVMILNDDDYLMHDAIEVMLALYARYRDVVMIGGHSIHFSGDEELATIPKAVTDHVSPEDLVIDVRVPAQVRTYRGYNDLNMTHSGCCFLKGAWQAVGGYLPARGRRVVPFSDRDFQLRVNALYPVGTSLTVPFSFWRRDSSVDHGRNT